MKNRLIALIPALFLALPCAAADTPFSTCTPDNAPPAPSPSTRPLPMVIAHAKWAGADLKGLDLSRRLFCDSDLSGARLDGADLRGAGFGGGSTLAGAKLTGVQAAGAMFEDVDLTGADFSGADLSQAAIGCDPDYANDDFLKAGTCATEVGSLADSTLTAAKIYVSNAVGSGGNLAGTTLWLPEREPGLLAAWLVRLGKTLKPDDSVTLKPGYAQGEGMVTMTGARIAAAGALLTDLRHAIKPGFDCAKAGGEVERRICADPDLSALDAAFSALWSRVPDRKAELPAQRAWLAARAKCTDDICIRQETAKRMLAIAPLLPTIVPKAGTYLPQPSVPLPATQAGRDLAALLKVALPAADTMAVTADGTLTGSSLGGNFHVCGIGGEDGAGETVDWQGALATLVDSGDQPATLVVTPEIIVPGENMHQYCGARAGWVDYYFRAKP